MYINSAQDEEDEDVFRIFSLAKQADEVLNPKLPKSPHRYLAVDFVLLFNVNVPNVNVR